jgi:hypothetical protein
MSMATSLLDFILNLLRNDDAKAAFVANPDKALAEAGLSEVCSEDVSDAMAYVAEYHPVTFVGNREYHLASDPGPGDSPHPISHHAPEPPHASPVHQLEYVTNNYAYNTDSHNTVIDKSVNQNIWNEGTLNQRFDDHSVTATDHSVAAGGDINGTVTNGNHNLVGDGNEVGNTSHRDDHSTRDSFNGNNIADHGSVAGTDNDGNATNPHGSNVATTDSGLDASAKDSHNTTNTDSHNDSHNRETHTFDSNNTDSHTLTDNDHSFNNESLNHDFNNHDSAITHTDQHGLINTNISPGINVPVHDNLVDLL